MGSGLRVQDFWAVGLEFRNFLVGLRSIERIMFELCRFGGPSS